MMLLEKSQERLIESQEAGKGADMGGRRVCENIETGEHCFGSIGVRRL